jgi:anti-sigma B factor antagonist
VNSGLTLLSFASILLLPYKLSTTNIPQTHIERKAVPKGHKIPVDTQALSQPFVTEIAEPLHDLAGERLRNAVREHVRGGRRDHLFDLRALTELDSVTLGSLIRALRIVRESGGSVALIVDQPSFLRILSITGLDRVFPVFKDESGARASFGAAFAEPALA